MNYIAYYRVSTKKQGNSGLGLEAQEKTVREYVERNNGKLIEEYTEIESGKKIKRPILMKSMDHCLLTGATLITAKLDRLARNAAFCNALFEKGVDIAFCDFPKINKFVMQILAAVGEYEAKLTSDRTIAALCSRKERGLPLGNPRELQSEHAERGRQRGREAVAERVKEYYRRSYPFIAHHRQEGKSLTAIAQELKETDHKTPLGKKNWNATMVKRILDKGCAEV